MLKKILIIRFSSIGDIVLTTPVIRCLKEQIDDVEIHFLTKKSFAGVLKSNPYLDKVLTIEKEVKELAAELKEASYDFVVDLHKNIRSRQVKSIVNSNTSSFSKLNWEKWLLTNFKVNKMPDVHIVERYFDTVTSLGVKNDNKGLDFFIQQENEVEIEGSYIAIVVGAAHATKALTIAKTREIISELGRKVVLVGGPNDKHKADVIKEGLNADVVNGCGIYNLEQSASVLKGASVVITPDTGMMHIASALQKPVISVWGNTVPEFGMYPYIPEDKSLVHVVENKELSCRPCSKIGHEKCPKKHFRCIEDLQVSQIKTLVSKYI